VLRSVRRLPFLKLLAIAQLLLLARRHFLHLDPAERRRLAELVRRGRSLTPAEREELRGLVQRLEPRAFAGAAADAFSPFSTRRFGRRR
jgi:triphosphoribosyl-dephospho-CoA synthetase